MLPISVIANWCSAEATPDGIESALAMTADSERLKDVIAHPCRRGSVAFTWVERTRLSFGGSDWYSIDGSLLVNGRRAVLYRQAPNDPGRTHVVLIALLPTSLAHLKNKVTSLVESSLHSSLSPVELPLGKIAWRFYEQGKEAVNGVGIASAGGERRVVFQEAEKIFGNYGGLFSDDPAPSDDEPDREYVSELYLRFADPDTELSVSRDGTLTFSDPQVTLDQIEDVLARIDDAHRRSRGSYNVASDSNRFVY